MNYVLGKRILNILNHVIFPDTENISLPSQNMKFVGE
jgi:hypothetical protein